jgi:arginase
MGWITVASIRERGAASALEAPLQRMKAQRVHVHIDLDVHDAALAPANEFAPPDGLTPAEVQNAVRAIAAGRPISSASIAAYDPAVDPHGQALEAGLKLIELLASVGGSAR